MNSVDMYYLVRPKPVLEKTFGKMIDYKYELFFATPHLWKWKRELDDDGSEHTTTLVKLVFMLTLAKMSLNNWPNLELWLPKLLGQPMEFSIARFDEWWSIEEYPFHRAVEHALVFVDLDPNFMEAIDLLDVTGFEETFEWMMGEYHILLNRKVKEDRVRKLQTGSNEINTLLYVLDEGIIKILSKPKFETKESAYNALKILTKEDFGYDVDAWHRFFVENDPWVTRKGYMDYLKLLETITKQKEQNKDS